MKRIFSLALIAVMLLSLAACKKQEFDPMPYEMENPPASNDDTIKVETDYDVPYHEELTFDYDLTKYVTLPDYKNAAFEFDYLATDDASIENDIVYLKLSSAKCVKTEKAEVSEEGDLVTFTYTATNQKTGAKAIQGSGIEVLLGEEMFAPDFDQFLTGAKKGNAYKFTYTFPSEWAAKPSVAGQTLVVSVTIDSVKTVVLPDISAVLEEQEIETEAELKELLIKEREGTNTYNFIEKIIKDSAVITYPEKEYNFYLDQFESDVEARAKGYGTDRAGIISSEYGGSEEKFNEAKTAYANNKCKRSLVLYYLQDQYGFEVSKDTYNYCLAEYFALNGAEMGLESVDDAHTKMGQALANSIFTDLAANAAYNDR